MNKKLGEDSEISDILQHFSISLECLISFLLTLNKFKLFGINAVKFILQQRNTCNLRIRFTHCHFIVNVRGAGGRAE